MNSSSSSTSFRIKWNQITPTRYVGALTGYDNCTTEIHVINEGRGIFANVIYFGADRKRRTSNKTTPAIKTNVKEMKAWCLNEALRLTGNKNTKKKGNQLGNFDEQGLPLKTRKSKAVNVTPDAPPVFKW